MPRREHLPQIVFLVILALVFSTPVRADQPRPVITQLGWQGQVLSNMEAILEVVAVGMA